MKKLLNLIGQIRIYSLVDLILLIIAIGSSNFQIAGVVFLHLGFLLFLEMKHKHEYRALFPKYLWVVLMIVGVFFYNNILVIGFLVCSFLYTKKNLSIFGLFGPFFRGLQYYFLVSGIIGLLNPISFIIATLLVIRNFTGDLRDVIKDKREGMKTLPIVFGAKNDIKYIHLITMLTTTFFWWYLSGISILWLIVIYIIQLSTYNLTPR